MKLDTLKANVEKLRESLKSDNRDKYAERLKEEGLKSLIVVPILQDYLGFDDIDDYEFEYGKVSNRDRSDILIRQNFLLELKKFNLLENPQNRRAAERQIIAYLEPDDDIYYGILTDGNYWSLFMEKRYVERFANNSREIAEIEEDIPSVISFSISNEHFWDLLLMFHRECYEDNMQQLARGVLNRARKLRGGIAWYNLFSKVKEPEIRKVCGDVVKQQIEDTFWIDPGEFFDELKKEKVSLGDRYCYEDDFIRFEVTIEKNGWIKIDSATVASKGLVKEALQYYPKREEMIKSWTDDKNDNLYKTKIDVIKDLKDSQKLRNQASYEKNWRAVK